MFSASLQHWLKGRNRTRRGSGARARRACRFRPGGETLEARELLATTLVTPHGPAPGGAPVQINNVQVVPIFWGWPNPSILTSPLQKAQWAGARLSIMNFLSQLTSTGKPIGELDMMIAAHAISQDAVLVTNNLRHYQRIKAPLMLENWA